MKFIKGLAVLILYNLNCAAQNSATYLIGTWKVEGEPNYEIWSADEEGNLRGQGFKLVDNQKVLLESLAIIRKDGDLVYQALVPNQNEGRTISFVLNKTIEDALSFENPTHDFPTQIVYQKVNDNRLLVKVSGADGMGFSFYMDRE